MFIPRAEPSHRRRRHQDEAEPRVAPSGLCRKAHGERSRPALDKHLQGGDGDGDDNHDDDDDEDDSHSCV